MKKRSKPFRKFSIFYQRRPVCFFFVIAVVVFFLWCGNWLLTYFFIATLEQRGVYGDSFGSINALFTGMAFVGLIATLLLQQKELKLQRREIKLQRLEVAGTRSELAGQRQQMEAQNAQIRIQVFENTFFNMLSMFNEFIREITGPRRADAGQPSVGRDQIAKIVSSLAGFMSAATPDSVARSYLREYGDNIDDLAAYFRILFNMIKFIDNSGIENKKLYTNILRAQLSESELVLFYLNSRTQVGEPFLPMIRKYDLLKHCPTYFLGLKIEDIGAALGRAAAQESTN